MLREGKPVEFAPLAQIGLLLVDPDRESARLHVRDVALFDRAVVATSVIADPPPG